MSGNYSVRVIDMAHYMDEDGERTVGGFESFEAAKAYARYIVRRSVEDLRAANQPSADLRRLWHMFGEDAFVVGDFLAERASSGARQPRVAASLVAGFLAVGDLVGCQSLDDLLAEESAPPHISAEERGANVGHPPAPEDTPARAPENLRRMRGEDTHLA